MTKKMTKRRIYLTITALFLGLLISFQNRSLKDANDQLSRDTNSSVFKEMKNLKDKDSDLRGEIADLKKTLKELTDQKSALGAIKDQIEKYSKFSGRVDVFGPGLEIKIIGKLSTPWLIDSINEFFDSGADAISVNGIRITNKTIGFYTLPQGQILLNGSILASPYIINVVGESATLLKILEAPGGIFSRLTSTFPDLKIQTTKKEIIEMKANL